jgi:hypothetical protein
VGDSSTNFLTPRMPYFPLALSFCHRYAKRAEISTLLSTMRPFALAFWACGRCCCSTGGPGPAAGHPGALPDGTGRWKPMDIRDGESGRVRFSRLARPTSRAMDAVFP